MTDEGTTTEIHTIRSHRSADGTLDSVAVTVEFDDATATATRVRVHYVVEDGLAALDHFVVDDDLSVFEVADLRCVPLAERALTVVPGVDRIEPAEETFERALERGRQL